MPGAVRGHFSSLWRLLRMNDGQRRLGQKETEEERIKGKRSGYKEIHPIKQGLPHNIQNEIRRAFQWQTLSQAKEAQISHSHDNGSVCRVINNYQSEQNLATCKPKHTIRVAINSIQLRQNWPRWNSISLCWLFNLFKCHQGWSLWDSPLPPPLL